MELVKVPFVHLLREDASRQVTENVPYLRIWWFSLRTVSGFVSPSDANFKHDLIVHCSMSAYAYLWREAKDSSPNENTGLAFNDEYLALGDECFAWHDGCCKFGDDFAKL